jgi:predicted Holliday junction resolvase-like endonuclease
MNLTKEAKEIIRTLEDNNFYVECPCCGGQILLKNAGLFYLDHFSPEAEELYQKKVAECKLREKELREKRKKISEKSEISTTAINIGFISERIAPLLEDFSFERNDCRSLFDPIDYVIFEGLSKKNSVSKILFTEIKTGKARLNPHEKEIRNLVERNQVTWDTCKKG